MPFQPSKFIQGRFGHFTQSELGARNHLGDVFDGFGYFGEQLNKQYITSGLFTTTVRDSSLIGPGHDGIAFDTTDTMSSLNGSTTRKFKLGSGRFTSTLKTSLDVSSFFVVQNIRGVSIDLTDYYTLGDTTVNPSTPPSLFYMSGKFTTTIKDSEPWPTSPAVNVRSLAWDNVNTTLMSDRTLTATTDEAKLFLISGRFTSTIKDSEVVEPNLTSGGSEDPFGVTYTGNDTAWLSTSGSASTAWLTSGQFTSTIKTSLAIGTVDGEIRDCDWAPLSDRLI